MLETNPFSVFCPLKAKYLVLGGFASKDGKKGVAYNWYYSNGRNQFWPILEGVYGIDLKDITAKQDLFTELGIAIADTIIKCERQGNSSLDKDLRNFEYNFTAVENLLKDNPIKKIFFTSRFVENIYKKYFKELIENYPHIELITLPSPSPRYAVMKKEEKVKKYADAFPSLSNG